MNTQLALPNSLYADVLSYGMTGTTEGATNEQMSTLDKLLTELGLDFCLKFYWHFGDALGADAQCFIHIITRFPFAAETVAHPGTNITGKRAFCKASKVYDPMDNVARDERIAYCAHQGLFVLPRQYNEILRSGTWTTARRTGKFGRPCWIIKPDGRFDYYPEGYKTILRRDMVDRDDFALL